MTLDFRRLIVAPDWVGWQPGWRKFHKQLLGNAQPLLLASGVLVALALLPGLPTIPFLLMGGGLGTVSWRMRQKTVAAIAADSTVAAWLNPRKSLEGLLKVEPPSVSKSGWAWSTLVERGAEPPLLTRVSGIRRQLATQLGYLMPPVKVKDNVALRSRE